MLLISYFFVIQDSCVQSPEKKESEEGIATELLAFSGFLTHTTNISFSRLETKINTKHTIANSKRPNWSIAFGQFEFIIVKIERNKSLLHKNFDVTLFWCYTKIFKEKIGEQITLYNAIRKFSSRIIFHTFHWQFLLGTWGKSPGSISSNPWVRRVMFRKTRSKKTNIQ